MIVVSGPASCYCTSLAPFRLKLGAGSKPPRSSSVGGAGPSRVQRAALLPSSSHLDLLTRRPMSTIQLCAVCPEPGTLKCSKCKSTYFCGKKHQALVGPGCTPNKGNTHPSCSGLVNAQGRLQAKHAPRLPPARTHSDRVPSVRRGGHSTRTTHGDGDR